MTNFKNIKQGDILAETQFYVVEKTKGDKAQLKTSTGVSIVLDEKYIETFLSSGDQFDSEEKLTKTAIADKLLGSARVPVTVCYTKANKAKTKKAIKAEKEQWAIDVKEAFLNKGVSALEEFADKPVLDYTPGDERIMKGHHYGELNELGRLSFIDLEDENRTIKQVDPRSIKWVIVDNVKYILK